MTELFDPKNISKQEVIDYIIRKKVRVVEESLESLHDSYNALEKNRNEITKSLYKELNTFSGKYIKSNYGKIITQIEKNLKAKSFIIPAYLDKETLPLDFEDIIRFYKTRGSEAMVLFISDSSFGEDKGVSIFTLGSRFRGGDFFHYLTKKLKSFLKVDMEEVSNPKIDKLREKKKEISERMQILSDELNKARKEIETIRRDRDKISDYIIEEALLQTEEGKKFLDAMSTIEIGTKLLG